MAKFHIVSGRHLRMYRLRHRFLFKYAVDTVYTFIDVARITQKSGFMIMKDFRQMSCWISALNPGWNRRTFARISWATGIPVHTAQLMRSFFCRSRCQTPLPHHGGKRLSTTTTRQTTVSHTSKEKKMTSMTATVATTLTKSGMVWAMNPSIFSMFWSIVFLIAPVDVLFRYPNGSLPMCSDKRTRNPYKIRNAATWEDIRAAYSNTNPPTSPQTLSTPAHHIRSVRKRQGLRHEITTLLRFHKLPNKAQDIHTALPADSRPANISRPFLCPAISNRPGQTFFLFFFHCYYAILM